jgi:hypothetical protein
MIQLNAADAALDGSASPRLWRDSYVLNTCTAWPNVSVLRAVWRSRKPCAKVQEKVQEKVQDKVGGADSPGSRLHSL